MIFEKSGMDSYNRGLCRGYEQGKAELADVLDKISAEIERLDAESWELSVTDVLNVIDRYREGVSE